MYSAYGNTQEVEFMYDGCNADYSTDNRFGEMIADNLPDLKSLKLCGKEVDRGVGDAGCFYLSRLRELERVELVKNELMSVGVGKLLRNVRCAEFNFGSG